MRRCGLRVHHPRRRLLRSGAGHHEPRARRSAGRPVSSGARRVGSAWPTTSCRTWMLPTGGLGITLAAGWFMTRETTESQLMDDTTPGMVQLRGVAVLHPLRRACGGGCDPGRRDLLRHGLLVTKEPAVPPLEPLQPLGIRTGRIDPRGASFTGPHPPGASSFPRPIPWRSFVLDDASSARARDRT